LAWWAAGVASKPPTARHTYGLRRASILAAFGNSVILMIAVGGIVWEAIQRLHRPVAPSGGTMMAVAGVGVVLNTVTALLFWSGRKRDLNIRGAFLHLSADAAVSLGVVIAGALILRTGRLWIDPAMSLGIGAVIVWGTWGLLCESFSLAMDAVPAGLDIDAIEAFLTRRAGVTAIHDLHVWAMSTTETALTVHIVCPGSGFNDAKLAATCAELHDRFGIAHTTIQIERGDGICSQAPADVV
jgi:cobalt-zinc-cadmium efflux system protein